MPWTPPMPKVSFTADLLSSLFAGRLASELRQLALLLNHQFRRKETLSDRILIGLLGTNRSRCQQKSRANAEKSGSHFIPPHRSSREHSNTICQVSASSPESRAPASPVGRRWGPAIQLVFARRLGHLLEPLARSFAVTSVQLSALRQSRRPP